MTHKKTFLKGIAISIFMLCCSLYSAAEKPTKIYMFGFAASFNDSTVYFTDIQTIDSAYLYGKGKILGGRDNYSYQLRNYMQEHGFANATCVTSFSKTHKDIEKKYVNMKKKYAQKNKYTVKYITSQNFSFYSVKPNSYYEEEQQNIKKAEKPRHKDKRPDNGGQPPMGAGQRNGDMGGRMPMPGGGF